MFSKMTAGEMFVWVILCIMLGVINGLSCVVFEVKPTTPIVLGVCTVEALVLYYAFHVHLKADGRM